MFRKTSCLAVLLLLPGLVVADPRPPLTVREPAGEIAGALVIAGGGQVPDAVRKRFVELAGGKNAKLVVIPTASTAADTPDAAKLLEPWQKMEVASAVLFHARKRDEADSAEFIKPLTEATAIWLEGGDQARLIAAYQGTAVEKEMRKLLTRSGVIGGNSAGAAVMGPSMITGPDGAISPGFGFLPGFVVDQHVLKRSRVDRLTAAVAARPGLVGLGVDEGTAVVVKGRRLQVIGDSYALVCLPASDKRPAATQVLKAGDSADLIALSRAAIARCKADFPPEKPQPPVVGKGGLIIGGGGGMPAGLWKRFIQMAGGPDALIVVVPTALEDPVPAEPGEAKSLKRSGAKNVQILHTRNRAEADKPEFAAVLKDARGIWFSGGRQWRFVDAYEGTATEKAFHQVLDRGGVIGGSSAGASIQSEYMPRGDPLGNLKIMAEGYERGFGFLKGAAVDQHFFARKRQKDMSLLVKTYPQLLGIGIDESTAIVVQGNLMEVVGKGKVAVYDRRKPAAAGEKDYEEIDPGKRYNLETRKPAE